MAFAACNCAAGGPVPVGGPSESPAPSQRVDCSLGTEQFYADSRGGVVFLGQLALDGTAALMKDAGVWWVIPTTTFVDFAFAPALLKASDKETLEVVGYAEDGSTVGAPTLRWSVTVTTMAGCGFATCARRLD